MNRPRDIDQGMRKPRCRSCPFCLRLGEPCFNQKPKHEPETDEPYLECEAESANMRRWLRSMNDFYDAEHNAWEKRLSTAQEQKYYMVKLLRRAQERRLLKEQE